MTQKIHIVSVGARTPLGLNAASSFAAVRAGISRIDEHLFAFDKFNEPVRIALDFSINPPLEGPDRLMRMAASALADICAAIDFNQPGLQDVGLIVALPEERPGWKINDNLLIRDRLSQVSLPVTFKSIEVVPKGHAAGLIALDMARYWIKNGTSQLCIVLGVDSYVNYSTLDWLDNNRQLANSYNRGAFFPGEGAGAVLIASDHAVSRHQLDSLAVIRALATSMETKLIKTDAICLGEGLTACVREVTQSLKLPDQRIDGVICDINGERYRAEEWGFVILRCADAFVDPTAYDMPASYWGDVGAASGPLFMGLAVAAGKRGWAKGSRYMIWNSSEGGERAAALVELNGYQKGM